MVHTRQIKITGNAGIVFDGGAPENTGGGKDQTQSAPQTGGGPGPARTNANITEGIEDMVACQHKLFTLVNEKYGDAPLEVKMSATNTLFIECAKSGYIHNFRKLYGKKTYPPAPSDPSKWRECVISSGKYEGKTLADVEDADLLKLFEYYDTHADKKVSNSHLAECVYQAAQDRNILPKPAPEPDIPQSEQGWDPEEDPSKPPF